ncbi:hypothetical protein J2755_002242 [Methanohalophilus levihalophilus]|uniref:hypothetical protein n=1 Tax=Methanohalophilus levihalophilus TaxID=1431282 RepID=UPI001AE33BB6|nr:hypothetical protein [Methanohalophilus levihalophilus]MBP2031279.1 hypothetical protein [Methanohalophilus levihalophilus]
MGCRVVSVAYKSEGFSVKEFWNNLSSMQGESRYQTGKLDFEIGVEKTSIKPHEVFKIDLKMTNTGAFPVNLLKMYEHVSYELIFCYPDGSEIPYECEIVHKSSLNDNDLVELHPGVSIIASIECDCWYLREGEYQLYAVYHTTDEKNIKTPYWHGKVKSNSVKIVVH